MEKTTSYKEISKQILAVVEGETNLIARMATVSNLLHHHFDDFFWTGFYVVDPDNSSQLVVGPYQGTMGCLRIDFGKGVCGTAAASRETVIVDDVHAFEGHITCDPNSRSEIVVPVLDGQGKLIAVLDVDSDRENAFDEVDRDGLEAILGEVFSQ
ncbi:MAG: GAF domain-containing protein [Pseudomonadota bacterium]